MSFRELAEITHFHLFTMPVVFMILIHVMYLTSASHTLKTVTTWAGFGGVMLGYLFTCETDGVLITAQELELGRPLEIASALDDVVRVVAVESRVGVRDDEAVVLAFH